MASKTIRRSSRRTPNQDQLIQSHLGFAKSLAHRLRSRLPSCVDVEELESDAYLGLLKAARTFDPHRGVLFRTYAAKRIFGAMLDGLRERGQCRLRYPRPHIDSLDIEIPCGDGRTIRLSDTIASDDEPVGSALEIREEAEHLLRQLEPRSRRYLRDNTLRGLMQKEIARRECVSPARISQRMKAIHKELAELRSEHARAA